jgi:hypothetical protein
MSEATMKLSPVSTTFAAAAILGVAALLSMNGCVDDSKNNAAAGGTGNAGTGGSGGVTSTTTGGTTATGVGGEAGSTSTAGSSGVDCSNPAVVTSNLIADFENWDGTTAGKDYQVNFNGAANVTLGFFELTDGTGSYSLGFTAGDASSYALTTSNAAATDWGGGFGTWNGCMNASSFTGLSVSVNCTTPATTAGVTLGYKGMSYSTKISCTGAWVALQLPFTSFASDNAAAPKFSASAIETLSFAAHMKYAQDTEGKWVPQPGAYSLSIDNLGFY